MRRLSLTCVAVLALMLLGASAFGPAKQTAMSSVRAEAAFDPILSLQQGLEYNTNRPGSDYKDYELSQADPARCRDDCMNDPTCRAFTYVRPGIQGSNAHCWLKNDVPGAAQNSCCVSGVKSGGSADGGLEVNIDRRGGDYKNYDLNSNDPNRCRNDCKNDPNCRAFTYARPSFFGPKAHCFLKDSVPEKTQNSCCISGVVRTGGGGGQIAWRYVGDQDCSGHDIGESNGSTPNPKQPSIQSGYTAVCWDNAKYRHNSGRVFCTYKSITPERCSGGSNRGAMYQAVRQ